MTMIRVATAAVLCCVPSLVAAQTSEPSGASLDRWQPALDLEAVAGVHTAERPLLGSYDFWLTVGLVNNLLEVTDDDAGITGSLVGPRLVSHVGGSMTLLPALQVGMSLPVVFYQARGDPVSPAFGPVGDFAAAGIGALGLMGKYHLLAAEAAWLDLAAVAGLNVPTHYPREAYLGERNVAAWAALAASRRLLGLDVGANLGYHWRPSTRFLDAEIGPEIRLGLGASYDLQPVTALPFEAAVAWHIAMRHDAPLQRINESPSELLFEATYRTLPLVMSAGVGVGLIAGIGTPDVRVMIGARWAHRPHDVHGGQDAGGGLDEDRDEDDIPDVSDACPDEPENWNDFEDEDGCPDSRASLQGGRIAINGNVHFEVGKAILKPEGEKLLDEIAQVLQGNPQVEHVRIEGHTDSDGGVEFNQILSQDRADAVRRYLIRKGIAASRLTAVGYGQTRPVATNDTAAGRAQNRRVEFVIEDVEARGESSP